MDEISFGANNPFQWEFLSENERKNSLLTQEQCRIKKSESTHYFIRACMDIPIKGTDQFFAWGVWVSLSEQSFLEISEHWDDPERINFGPYFGWLCTRIPEYPDTMLLKEMVHQRQIGLRPLVQLEPTDHPLAMHQRDGIESEKLKQIIIKLLHQNR